MEKIFITGTSTGLGLALSQTLRSENREIIGFARNRGDFEGEYHSSDLTKPSLVHSILNDSFQAANLTQAERIVFINNAGQLGPLDKIQNLDFVDIEQNLTANLVSTSIALSLFVKTVSEIPVPKLFVNITSGAADAEKAKPGWALYCASKAGQEQLIRSVSKEQKQADHPITLINFSPGVMETGMQRLIRATPESSFPEVKRFIELKEQGRVPEPSQIARRMAQAIFQFETLENGKTYRHENFEPID